MSIIHIEGFDNIAIADLGATGYATGGTIQSGAGRFGGASFGRNSVADSAYISRPVSASAVCTGAALVRTANPTVSNSRPSQFAATTALASAGIGLNTTGQILYFVAGSIVDTGPVMALNQFHYFEISVDASGNVLFRLDGKQVAGGNHADLGGTKTAVLWGDTTVMANHNRCTRIDDWYIKDDINFLGDSVVVTRYPTADSSVVWTPSGTGGNFAQVDETTPNADTDYVSSATAGAQDFYTSSTAIPGTPVLIHAVGTRMFSKKDDTALREVRTRIKSGTATADGPVHTLSTSYTAQDSVFETDPATGVAWLQAAVNASEFGPRVVT